MDKKNVEKALVQVFDFSKKRNFDESLDVIFTFKNLNLKNPEHRVDFSVTIPNPFIKDIKTLAFVKDKNLLEGLKGVVDKIVLDEDISKMSKKEKKQMANSYDFFLAEGPVMLTVGRFLGQFLSPKGKMPLIVPNPEVAKAMIQSAKSTIKINNKRNKTSVSIQTRIGKKSQTSLKVAENIMTIYNSLVDKLPAGEQNFKNIYVKTTMSSPVKVGDNK
ncbi:MAG: hypothetical protein PHR26_01180 [Candidatus ainarchaeum sp.]|nr:hypothetical protein [Candidatus ainarchaeum sp.]MDD3976015.1 hypothetical protein [Candidatus ainarchaeum sp.]